MAASIPTVEPLVIVAGVTAKWTKSLSDYPATTWALSYAFVNASGYFAVTATASGTDHLATIAAATTADIDAGTYKWQAKVTDGSEVFLVGEGTLEVRANFAAVTTNHDGRTDAEVMLDALNAMLRGKATADQQSMSLNGRSLSRYSPAELRIWRDNLLAEVKRERDQEKLANGQPARRKILTRLS